MPDGRSVHLGTGGDQGLAGLVAGVLGKVLDEAGGQVLGLLVPLSGIGIGVPGIQDAGVHALQLSGDLQTEVGDGLGGGVVDGAVEDGVDDAAGVSLMEMRLPVPFQPVFTR